MNPSNPSSPSSPTGTRVSPLGEREIRVERVFAAPRDRVWRALTEPALVAQWWNPSGKPIEIERMEVRRGGRWRFVERAAAGESLGFEGRYREVEPLSRLVFSFEWDGMPGHVAIQTWELEELAPERTRLVTTVLTHTTDERDGMLHTGMQTGFDRTHQALDRLFERGAA
jgi:uncharacterized protein YndB with AHSA1/START domain